MSKGKQLESFNTAYVEYKKQGKLDLQTFISLNNAFAKFMMNLILEGEILQLPSKLGIFQVIGKKIKISVNDDGSINGATVNWGETNKLWETCEKCKNKNQLVYHFNEHSEGIRYRFVWSRNNMHMMNKNCYTFVPARRNKKLLYEKVIEGKEYQLVEGRYMPILKGKS